RSWSRSSRGTGFGCGRETPRRQSADERSTPTGSESSIFPHSCGSGIFRACRRGGAMLVRDFGPEHNAKLIALYPERRPYVWLPNPPDSVPRLVPYDSGMAVIWGTAGAPLD